MSAIHLTPQGLVLAGLLAHQTAKVWEQGFSGLHHNYAPVFAVQLPSWVTFAGQSVALPAALVVSASTESTAGRFLSVGLLAFWMLSIQRRLANHVWLGAIAVAALTFAPQALDAVIARDLLMGLYLSAAVFKIHAEYLFSERSAGRVVTGFYLDLLGVRLPLVVLRWLPVVVIAAEGVTGALLWNPDWALAALCIAVAMHWAFGVSGNFAFSIVAMTLWLIAVASRDGGLVLPDMHSAVWAMVPLSVLLAVCLARTARGPRPPAVLLKDALQGAVFGALAAAAVGSPLRDGFRAGPGSVTVHWLVGAGFAVNFLLVLTGVKLEWSFAMFSSLRPYGRSWLQRGGRRDWPRYYALTLPDRLPRALLSRVQPEFLYQATRSHNAVHESVVHRLEAAAQDCRTTFAPCLVVAGETGRELVRCTSADQPKPRRTVLLFPTIVPRSLDRQYLG